MKLPEIIGTYTTADHKAKLMCGDPQAQALQWIIGYLDNLNHMVMGDDDDDRSHSPISLNELLETAMSHVESDWGDYITRGGVFEGVGTDPTFWDKLSILHEKEIDHGKRGSFFSCSC